VLLEELFILELEVGLKELILGKHLLLLGLIRPLGHNLLLLLSPLGLAIEILKLHAHRLSQDTLLVLGVLIGEALLLLLVLDPLHDHLVLLLGTQGALLVLYGVRVHSIEIEKVLVLAHKGRHGARVQVLT